MLSEGTQLDKVEGDICNDIFLVLFHSNVDFSRRTVIWNWRTGERLFHSVCLAVPLVKIAAHGPLQSGEIQTHKLLSPSLVLQLTTRQQLRVFDLYERRIVARLGLPPTRHSLWQEISNLERDTPASYTNTPVSYRRGWLSGPENDILIFKSMESPAAGSDYAGELQGIRMVVSGSSLLRVLSLYTEVGDTSFIPWRQWNSTARLFLGLHSLNSEPSCSRWGVLVNEEAFRAMEEGSWDGSRVYRPEKEGPSFPGNHHRYIAIMDFNSRVIRRANANGTPSIDSDTSVVRTVQHATVVVAPEIFLTPVVSSLPFRVSCCRDPVDYQDVELDFENLAGYKTSQVRLVNSYHSHTEAETLEPNPY